MKKILSFMMVAVLAVMLGGCEKYDDSELRSRVSALESLNTYQTLLQKLQAGKTVTAYSQSGNEITLTFSDGSSVKFNQQGVPGESIKGDPGESIKGDPGKDGVTPQFKIEGTSWKVSYDEGKTWTDAGEAVEKSLFQSVTADGNTLTITLADGTVIPVFYGEKEGYGFTVANGRKCFSFYETLASERTGKMTLDYTLTGELSSVDDVTFVTNITPLTYDGSSPGLRDVVTIEPADAKSGTITINRLVGGTVENGSPAKMEDGEYWLDFPGMIVDVMAVFPDGSVRVQKLRFLDESITVYVENEDGDTYFYCNEAGVVCIDIPSSSGAVTFNVYHTIIQNKEDRALYDGDPLPQRPFSDCFYTSQWGNTTGTNSWSVTTSVGTTNVYDAYGITYEYPVTFRYNANTTAKERRTWFSIIKKSDPDKDTGGYVYWQIYVHQAPAN